MCPGGVQNPRYWAESAHLPGAITPAGPACGQYSPSRLRKNRAGWIMPFQRGKRPDLAFSRVLSRPIRPDAGRYTFRPVLKEDLSLITAPVVRTKKLVSAAIRKS